MCRGKGDSLICVRFSGFLVLLTALLLSGPVLGGIVYEYEGPLYTEFQESDSSSVFSDVQTATNISFTFEVPLALDGSSGPVVPTSWSISDGRVTYGSADPFTTLILFMDVGSDGSIAAWEAWAEQTDYDPTVGPLLDDTARVLYTSYQVVWGDFDQSAEFLMAPGQFNPEWDWELMRAYIETEGEGWSAQGVPIPEPCTLLLVGLGISGAAILRRRRRS